MDAQSMPIYPAVATTVDEERKKELEQENLLRQLMDTSNLKEDTRSIQDIMREQEQLK